MPQGLDFGMGLAEPPMPTLADDLGPLGDHAADHRVRLDEPLPPDGQFQGATHVPEVDFVLVHVKHSYVAFFCLGRCWFWQVFSISWVAASRGVVS